MEKPQHTLRLVFWETTAACNLECVHCRRLDVSSTLSKDDLDTDQAKAMISEIAAFARPILVLSGGEPLMRGDVFLLARRAAALELPVALATNGTMIDDAMAGQIAASGIRRVAISFDGADAATHDSFRRQERSFAAALAGLRRLRARSVAVQINTTVTRHNEASLDAIYQMALREGAEALHLFMLVPVGCGLEIAEDQTLSAERYEAVLNWLYDVSQDGKIQTKATCAPHYVRIMRQRSPQSAIRNPQFSKGCLAGSGVCFVAHTGEVYPCGYLPVSAGNVTRQSFREIWEKSEVFGRLRDPSQLEGKCGLCEYRFVCEGCRARAYAMTGNFMAEEPFCEYVPKKKTGG